MSVVGNVGGWLKDNQHWVGAAGILIGAVISIYTYVATRESGEIALKFNTVKIAEAGVPGIKMSDKQNNPITGNVFGCEIIIWNSGNLSLGEKADRIREPLTIAFIGSVKMIDATVQDTKYVPADAIKLERNENQITIAWSQFDQGDAIKIFVVYAGASQSPITYRGRFLQTKITDLSEFSEEQPNSSGISGYLEMMKYNIKYHLYSAMMQVLMLVAMFICIIMITFRNLRESNWSLSFAILVAAIIVINTVMSTFGRVPSSSPF